MNSGRVGQLDILRALAVLMVIAHHYSYPYAPKLEAVGGGWMGVDLFFVLSGFLISGLIFREIDKSGSFSPVRFWIRRAFKIYPAFYFFLFIGWVVWGAHTPGGNYVSEVLFFQNYSSHTAWGHTWSLAVEEHFYLLLPVVILLLNRAGRLNWTPAFSLGLLAVCLVGRIAATIATRDFHVVTYQSHLRFDALFTGVAMSYLFYFRRDLWLRLSGHRILLGVLLVLPSAVLPRENWFVMTLGLTLNSIGFACLLRWSLDQEWLRSRPVEAIGAASYSIYLWQWFAIVPLGRTLPPSILGFWVVCCLCVVLGKITGAMVEAPALLLRDRLLDVVPGRRPHHRIVAKAGL